MVLPVVAVLLGTVLVKPPAPLSTAETERRALIEKRQAQERREQESEKAEIERGLCRQREACAKYDRVRLECAVAGDFKTCLRIKMGDDVIFADICSGYNEGGPGVPLDTRIPSAFRCFMLNNFGK